MLDRHSTSSGNNPVLMNFSTRVINGQAHINLLSESPPTHSDSQLLSWTLTIHQNRYYSQLVNKTHRAVQYKPQGRIVSKHLCLNQLFFQLFKFNNHRINASYIKVFKTMQLSLSLYLLDPILTQYSY